MLREIKLYGKLAKFVGQRTFQAAVSNAAEAVRFLLANFPGLEQHMADQHYKVLVGDWSLTLDEIHNPAGQQVIKIVPVIGGAGGGGTGSILAGIGLIAAAIVLGPAAGGFLGLGAGFGGSGGVVAATSVVGSSFGLIGGAAASAIGFMGAALALVGVAQMIAPTPSTASVNSVGGTSGGGSDPRESYSFNGVQNVSRQGVPVPIIFGEVVCGSVTVSAGIDVAQVTG
jgi:predicted phage tail protein